MIETPPLQASERLLVLTASPDRQPTSVLKQVIACLHRSDWDRLTCLSEAHGISGHLWYHLESVRKLLPDEVACRYEATYHRLKKRDLQLGLLLEETCTALTRAGVSFAVLKGPLLHQMLYGDRPIPRGSSDIDIFVFGGKPAFKQAIRSLSATQFLFSSRARPTWEEEYPIFHDLLLARDSSETGPFKLELHRAPSIYHVKGVDGRRFVEWLETQRSTLPWNSSWPGGPTELASLTSQGHLLYLIVNLFKDGIPSIRNIQDLSVLVHRPGNSFQWDELYELAGRFSMKSAVHLMGEVLKAWDNTHLMLPRSEISVRLVERFFKKRCEIGSILRWPLAEDRGAGSVLLFGAGACLYQLIRLLLRPGQLMKRSVVWVRQIKTTFR